MHMCSETVQLPRDLSEGALLLSATGQEELCIENYKGILEYTCECIRILAKNCLLEVKGSNLLIDAYSREEMVITGRICQIRYLPPSARRKKR